MVRTISKDKLQKEFWHATTDGLSSRAGGHTIAPKRDKFSRHALLHVANVFADRVSAAIQQQRSQMHGIFIATLCGEPTKPDRMQFHLLYICRRKTGAVNQPLEWLDEAISYYRIPVPDLLWRRCKSPHVSHIK